MCKYYNKVRDWHCPFPSESGKEFCIFHLPVAKKEPEVFWQHLASYLKALLDNAGTEATREWAGENSHHWIYKLAEEELVNRYAQQIKKDEPWRFTGFIFPPMDVVHNFRTFVFPVTVFEEAQFSGNAAFSWAQFSGQADFSWAQFSGWADFSGARFGGQADFSWAQFSGQAFFSGARFGGEAFFIWARFDAPVYFTQTNVTGLFIFYRAQLRNRMSFAGTAIKEDAMVLLWDINFVHGTSEISLDKGYQKGKIVEPAGQIEFRDILKGMNRISFLHTDIFTDRLWVRFLNVNWKKNPREFIFDAKFAFIKKWNFDALKKETGLSEDLIRLIPVFFSASEQSPEGSDPERVESLKRCESLVKQDVERIAREIRRSTEEYGSYSDAGDFYIAEMEYRRSKTEKKHLRPILFWLALSLYKWISDYGESPSRALGWILGVWLLPAGVITVIRIIRCFPCSQILTLCGNTLANMITLQFPAEGLLNFWDCSLFWIGHKIIGISIITLFLLAVRRRFRR